jgi:hypothetical protein
MIKLANLGDELLRIRDEYFFGHSDVDFAKLIGLSIEGFRKIISTDEEYKSEYTRRGTILAIAEGLNMEFEIKGEQIKFTKKENEIRNVTDDNELLKIFTQLDTAQKATFINLVRHTDPETQKLAWQLLAKILKED